VSAMLEEETLEESPLLLREESHPLLLGDVVCKWMIEVIALMEVMSSRND
jgi:hypothetical protein